MTSFFGNYVVEHPPVSLLRREAPAGSFLENIIGAQLMSVQDQPQRTRQKLGLEI